MSAMYIYTYIYIHTHTFKDGILPALVEEFIYWYFYVIISHSFDKVQFLFIYGAIISVPLLESVRL